MLFGLQCTSWASQLARDKVDVIVVQRSAGEYRVMGMEGGGCNWRRAVLVEEARVRFKGREVTAIDVEGLHFVAIGATVIEGQPRVLGDNEGGIRTQRRLERVHAHSDCEGYLS